MVEQGGVGRQTVLNECALRYLLGLACRLARRRGEVRPGERGGGGIPEGVEVALRYPENITLRNMAYFVAAPTRCYQSTYPRRWGLGRSGCSPACWQVFCLLSADLLWPTFNSCLPSTLAGGACQRDVPSCLPAAPNPTSGSCCACCSKRFRARWMVKKLVMLTCSLSMMLFVTEQYIQPTIDNSLRPMREMVSRRRRPCRVWLPAGPLHSCAGPACVQQTVSTTPAMYPH